jgi:hypothetical protein
MAAEQSMGRANQPMRRDVFSRRTSQFREGNAAVIRQNPFTGPCVASDCDAYKCRKHLGVLKKSGNVSNIEQTAPTLWVKCCATVPLGVCREAEAVNVQLNEQLAGS